MNSLNFIKIGFIYNILVSYFFFNMKIDLTPCSKILVKNKNCLKKRKDKFIFYPKVDANNIYFHKNLYY